MLPVSCLFGDSSVEWITWVTELVVVMTEREGAMYLNCAIRTDPCMCLFMLIA